ncbi:MAG TPA: GNAT family N-acetyltransferase [Myxococcaceae bacterium]|nr:GNAT family N-acetyltransferase [Myxococcaceae bacterium]
MTQPFTPHARPARMDDLPGLVDLVGQLGYPTEARAMEGRLDRLLARPLVHRVVVAPGPTGGKLLGAVHATRRETIESDDHVEISGLIVDAEARGTGVGKLLVAAAERWARDLGLPTVRVRSNVVRTGAHDFYRRLGFRELKQQIAFIKEL